MGYTRHNAPLTHRLHTDCTPLTNVRHRPHQHVPPRTAYHFSQPLHPDTNHLENHPKLLQHNHLHIRVSLPPPTHWRRPQPFKRYSSHNVVVSIATVPGPSTPATPETAPTTGTHRFVTIFHLCRICRTCRTCRPTPVRNRIERPIGIVWWRWFCVIRKHVIHY